MPPQSACPWYPHPLLCASAVPCTEEKSVSSPLESGLSTVTCFGQQDCQVTGKHRCEPDLGTGPTLSCPCCYRRHMSMPACWSTRGLITPAKASLDGPTAVWSSERWVHASAWAEPPGLLAQMCEQWKLISGDASCRPVVQTVLPLQGMWVWSWVQGLRFCMPCRHTHKAYGCMSKVLK